MAKKVKKMETQTHTFFRIVESRFEALVSDFAVDQLTQTSLQFVVPIPVVRRVVQFPFRAEFIALRHRVTENAVCIDHVRIIIRLKLEGGEKKYIYIFIRPFDER